MEREAGEMFIDNEPMKGRRVPTSFGKAPEPEASNILPDCTPRTEALGGKFGRISLPARKKRAFQRDKQLHLLFRPDLVWIYGSVYGFKVERMRGRGRDSKET
jgi:hypothetical protein